MYTVLTSNGQLKLSYSNNVEYYEFPTFKSVSSVFDTVRQEYYVSINFIANDKNNSLRLYLNDISNQPAWTNDAIGAQNAVEQISIWIKQTVSVVLPTNARVPRIIRSTGTSSTALPGVQFSVSFASTGTANASITANGNTVILKPGEAVSYEAGDPNIFLPGQFLYDTSTVGSELLIIFVS
jgi:hypothetical protein